MKGAYFENHLLHMYIFTGWLPVATFGASSWDCQRAGSFLSGRHTPFTHSDLHSEGFVCARA